MRVDFVGPTNKGRKPTAKESLSQPFGALERKGIRADKLARPRTRDLLLGKISDGTETAEALANDAPFALIIGIIRSEAMADGFAVTDDAVCAEVFQILSLFDGIPLPEEGSRGDCRAETGTTLVQEQDLATKKVMGMILWQSK